MPPSVHKLMGLFSVEPDGSLVWLAPPKNHQGLLGRPAGSAIPTHSGKSYWAVQVDGHKIKRSHIVFYLTRGYWPVPQVDHINGDSLDDRPSNLRAATATENAWNHRKRAKRSPWPMGVRTAGSGRFVARIGVNKRQITIGTFDSPELAAAAYQHARREHFGEFA